MVKGAHDLEVCIPAVGAGGLLDDQVAGIALVSPLGDGNIIETAVFLYKGFLGVAPLHTGEYGGLLLKGSVNACKSIYKPASASADS